MNKVLDINPNDYTCLPEPGVSIYALYEAIQAKGYDHMWIDTPDLGGGSVVAHMMIIGLAISDWRLCFLPERLLGWEWGRCLEIILGRLFLMGLVLTRSEYRPR
jgi:hypothetical protein